MKVRLRSESGMPIGRRVSTNASAWQYLQFLQGLREHPRRGHEVADGIRRALVPEFPYSIYYVVEDDSVEVLAVLHQVRHPSEWKRRL